jgi:hypothetical protein
MPSIITHFRGQLLIGELGGFVVGIQILQLALQLTHMPHAAAPKPQLCVQSNEQCNEQGRDDALRQHASILPAFAAFLQGFEGIALIKPAQRAIALVAR